MRVFIRPLLLLSIVLLVPILPFLVFGDRMEAWFEAWSVKPPPRIWVAALVTGLLATDILLPVPSSLVSTFGGAILGTWAGTLASWCGMTVGATLGFALARWLGPRFARWFARPEDLGRLARARDRYGPAILVVARGIPVFAEASVLFLGLQRLAWSRFLPAVIASNLGIAIAYSAFGNLAAQQQWFPLALGISIALPLAITAIVRHWLPSAKDEGVRG